MSSKHPGPADNIHGLRPRFIKARLLDPAVRLAARPGIKTHSTDELATVTRAFPLLLLPRELLLVVADLLDRASHSRLSRTCWYLTVHLQGHLFQRYSTHGDHPAMHYGCTKSDVIPGNELVVPVIQRALYYGVPATANDPICMGMTPLAVAARNGREGAVRYLLGQIAADVDGLGETGFTPLAHVLGALINTRMSDKESGSRVTTAKTLLSRGANPNCDLPVNSLTGTRPENALTMVIDAFLLWGLEESQAAHLMVALALRGARADGWSDNHTYERSWHPLAFAVHNWPSNPVNRCGRCWHLLAKVLLKNGADPNFGLLFGTDSTALAYAVENNNTTAIKLLVSHGAYLNPTGGKSLVYVAVTLGHYDSLTTLLELGASPDVVGATSAGMPVGRGHYVGTALGASIEMFFTTRATAMADDALRIFKALMSANSDVNFADRHGRTPLSVVVRCAIRSILMSWADWTSTMFFLHELLSHGADPNIPDELDITPLAICVRSGCETMPEQEWRIGVVRALIGAGADVNATWSTGISGPTGMLYTTGMPDTTSPLLEACINNRHISSDVLYNDYKRLVHLYFVQRRKLRSTGAFHGLLDSRCTNFALSKVPEDGWTNPVVPLLLKAGAKVNPRLLVDIRRSLDKRLASD